MQQDILLDNIKPKVFTLAEKENQKFEENKNRKALLYTVALASVVFFIFFLVSFDSPLPDPPPPPKVDYVEIDFVDDEINFGNDINGGMGDIEPLRQLAPAPEASDSKSEAADNKSDAPTTPNNPITDDNEPDAPVVNKPKVQMPKSSTSSASPTPRTSPTTTPTPAPQRPRTVMTKPGGTGPGGNNAGRDNGLSSQGNGRGSGNQGNPDGSPYGNGNKILKTADLKNGSSVRSALSESGTNYNGTISISIKVDANGNFAGLSSITASPRDAKGVAAMNFVRNNILSKLKFDAGNDNRKANLELVFRHND